MTEPGKRYYADSIYWVEVDRISPNPFQPRKVFDEDKLKEMAESVRQYGILQPLVVTRKEEERPDGGIAVTYELIAGERRLRAAKIAKLGQVPVVIRASEETDRMKLELAIIENLQREDLNPLDRAKAFDRLVKEFGMLHKQIAEKVARSREYVSNTIRMLALTDEMQTALLGGQMSEGHTRPLLMLSDQPEKQQTLFREIIDHKINVRESERRARRMAEHRLRKRNLAPEQISMEKQLTEALGTRVHIEARDQGGQLVIEFFSQEDLQNLLQRLAEQKPALGDTSLAEMSAEVVIEEMPAASQEEPAEDLYSVRNFTV